MFLLLGWDGREPVHFFIRSFLSSVGMWEINCYSSLRFVVAKLNTHLERLLQFAEAELLVLTRMRQYSLEPFEYTGSEP
jgi:hypothetical protein